MKLSFTSTLFLIFIFINTSYSQLKVKEHVWPKTTPTENIPDSLKDYDAIMVHYQHDIKNVIDLSAGLSFNIENIRLRVKINTQAGLEDYSTFSILKSEGSTVTKLDARTIKKSGQIIDLVNTDIKVLNIKPDEDFENLLNMRVSIPGVEVGDEIEIAYSLEKEGLKIGKDIKMHTDIPTMKSVFSYSTDNSIVTDLMMYNEMPEPKINKSLNESTFTWTLNNLPGLGNQYASDFTESLPFIRFAVRYVVINGAALTDLAKYGILRNDWSEIYDYYTNLYSNPNFDNDYKGTSFKKMMKDYNAKYPNESIINKIQYLVHFINDSIDVDELSKDQLNRSAIYYIENKKIDNKNINNFIREFLINNKIKYYVVFARDKRDGRMDINFTSADMITDVLYAIEDEKGGKYLLYPPSKNRKYMLNEVPPRLAGTESIMVYRKRDNSISSDVLKLRIPRNEYNANARLSMLNIQYQLGKNGPYDYKFKSAYTGDFSTNYRGYLKKSREADMPNKAFKENFGLHEIFNVDTFYSEKFDENYPYSYNFNYNGKVNLSHQKLDANTYSIPLEGLIDHFVLKTNDENRYLNYFCPFRYIDNYKIYLQFDKPVELLPANLEDNWVFDKIGNYMINVSSVNEKVILIESKLDIRNDKLNPQEFITLHQINESIKKTSGARILIKTTK